MTAPAQEEPFPAALLQTTGMLPIAHEWIMRTAQRHQPILALVGALSLLATALGQKVAGPTGTRTNLYLVSVAGTAAGKDHARTCIDRALTAAGLADTLGGDEIASGQGLLARVAKAPNTIFQLDEFGLLLQAVRSKNSGAHLVSIMTNLMKLFSSSGKVYRGAEYADQKARARIDIPYPCVNLHATTTPETLFPALGSADVTSGYLNRMLIVMGPEQRPTPRRAADESPPEQLVGWIKAARALMVGLQGAMPETPIRVFASPLADKIMNDFESWIELQLDKSRATLTDPLWTRAWENASKLATILACAKHGTGEALDAAARAGELEIDPTAAQWAVAFVKHVVGRMEREVIARVGDTEFDRWCQETLRVVRAGGTLGRTHAQPNEYSRQFRSLEPRQQDAVLLSLRRREAITDIELPTTPSGRGPRRQAFVCLEFVERAAGSGDTSDSTGQMETPLGKKTRQKDCEVS